jgi:hypothetical protein
MQKNDLPFYGKLAIAVLIVVALAEAIPEVINTILVLILIGLILGHYTKFTFLTRMISTVGK